MALNNLKCLICHKPNPTKPNQRTKGHYTAHLGLKKAMGYEDYDDPHHKSLNQVWSLGALFMSCVLDRNSQMKFIHFTTDLNLEFSY